MRYYNSGITSKITPQTAWDALSLPEKAEMMKVAVSHGITNLQDIRKKYNEFAEGGRIHIKPENRGKFTALKERTGHSATWFKKHGTPAQKKMATFALNARKWKHGDGGNLFDGESQNSNQMQIGRNYWQSNPTTFPFLTLDFPVNGGTLQEVVVTGKDRRKERLARLQQEMERRQNDYLTMSNDNTWVATPGNPDRTQNPHLAERALYGARQHGEWVKAHPILNTVGMGLGAAPFAVATYPFMAAAGEVAAPVLANPYVDAAMVSMGGADAAHSIANGGADAMTALELAPMIRPAKAVYDAGKVFVGPAAEWASEGLGKINQFLASPYTGKWTQFGNSEYRFRPGYIGMNGAPVESRTANNVTDNLLKWLGRADDYVPQKPVSQVKERYFSFYPEQGRMAQIWKENGVDLSRIGVDDLEAASKKRWDELLISRSDRHTIAKPDAEDGYFLHDIIPDNNTLYGWRDIGTTQIQRDAAGNMHMRDIINNTESVRKGKAATEHGVQERGLNAAIKVANSEGGEGVVSGEWWLSAPKQQHVVQKYHDREVIGNTGQHYNTNMVEERINKAVREGFPIEDDGAESFASSMLDLRRAGDIERKALFNQPFWLLRTPTYDVPVKSTLFNPTIIDKFGKMYIDWSNPNIFKGVAYPTLIGTSLYETQK